MKYCVLSCLILLAAIAIPVESGCGCRTQFKAVGCRKDKRHDRALPEMLINERDRYSKYYNKIDVDWENWDTYLPEFACRCADAAKKKGYKYIGLQFWGECWSGPTLQAEAEYDKHGKGDACYGLEYKHCTSKSEFCVGDNNHNFIYEIHYCPVKFERLGCYKDHNTRPLNSYILTDRDKSIGIFSGKEVDWYHFDTYLPEFACRCAMKTVEKGWNTFGLQYYGECWSGEKGDDQYYKKGKSSSCINKCYEKCHIYDPFCVGEQFTNYVYRVTTADVCEIPYKAVGCFNEPQSERALHELIIDDVNQISSKFMGIFSAEFSDWEEYMKGLMCRCARKIKEKGYTTFGINSGGKCYSSQNGDTLYAMHGSSEECYHNVTTPCLSSICTGGLATNYIYKLTTDGNNNTT